VLLFTRGLSLLTGLIMGFYPAWQSSRTDLVEGLKESGRSVSGNRAQHRFRRGLVAAQVGLSMVLLAAAVMLISSFIRLSNQESGFRSDHVWAGGLGLPPTRYQDAPARARFVQKLIDDLHASPGVEAVSTADALPLTQNWSSTPYARVEGNPLPMNKRPLGLTRSVSPGYFQTLRIPLLSGRDFTERDGADQPLVVILSNSTAKKLFPNENPIGHQILFGTDNGNGLSAEVIGIVGDVRSLQLSKSNDVEFYRPWPQRSFSFFNLLVRSATKSEATATLVRTVLDKIDKDMPILQPNTLDLIVTQSLGQQRLTMGLLGVFAGVALLLAVVGIYGAVAYTVEQRTAEIGVRMALGAQMRDVLHLVVRQGMNPVLFGLVIGLVATFVAGRLLAAQLYQVSPHNPFLIATTAAGLAIAALLACLIPARRATLVDPIQALRME
jgi:putative ABC transport system permease protein